MKQGTFDRVLYGLGIIMLAAFAFLASEATWADCGGGNGSDDPPAHGCEHNGGGDDDGGGDIDIDIDADLDVNANADASASATATGEGGDGGDSSVSIDARRPGTTIIGGGNSTASDQKVFAISGGWLTGSAGIRWDWTDKEARTLRIADDYQADGLVAVADDLRCSLKRIYRAVGGSRTKCNAMVDAERLALSGTSQGAQASEIDELRRMVQELSEMSRQATPGSPGDDVPYSRYEGEQGATAVLERVQDPSNCEPCPDCSEQATRAFKACVSK